MCVVFICKKYLRIEIAVFHAQSEINHNFKLKFKAQSSFIDNPHFNAKLLQYEN